jgi:hypothetical protein
MIPQRTAAELSPSQRRDSVLLHSRAPAVLDSLTRAGYDTAAIREVRAVVNAMSNPRQAAAAFAGRGGGGGRGGNAGGQACEHPTTEWEQFCARPGEQAGGRRGGGGGGRGFGGGFCAEPTANAPAGAGGASAARGGRGGRRGANATQGAMGDQSLNPVDRIWQLIGLPNPCAGGGRGGGGGGFGAGALGSLANTGDYLVTMTVNGQTYKQTFRVERVSGDEDAGFNFGGDEEHDGAGRYTPRTPKTR